MRETVTNLAVQQLYLVTHLTLADVVDMVLVAVIFFIVFQALARTRALQLLRGAITFAILGAAPLVLLPLNTFNWLLRGLLLAGAIALPLLFHDELRRALTGLGQVGRWRRGSGLLTPSSKRQWSRPSPNWLPAAKVQRVVDESLSDRRRQEWAAAETLTMQVADYLRAHDLTVEAHAREGRPNDT